MSWANFSTSTRSLLYSVTVMSLMALVFWFGVNTTTTEAGAKGDDSAIPQTAFPPDGGTLGAIPDGPAACNAYGANRDVTFTVAGMSAPLSNVAVSITLAPAHTWVGDLDVRLAAPGGAPEHILFSRTGAATATAAGSLNDAAGPYSFVDTAPAAPTWWASAASATTPIPTGSYRTSTAGEVAGGGANTLMTPAFAGLTTPQINGVWRLRFRDHCSADVGTVSAATLTLDGVVAPTTDAPVDLNGDGKTDYAVVRNVGGGPSGQVRWFYNINGSANPTVALDWGLATDFFVPEDFDGDGKDDITVWRPGAATEAAFYILNSATSTARVEAFGQSGDDPTVVGDYGGDEKADLAVYRPGAIAGQQSTWFYRTTPGGPVTYVPWGVMGDFEAPGDYNGDGKFDFCVQRNNGGQGEFWLRLSTGAQSTTIFGLSSDVVVPGDYDGDGKTDIATARAAGASIQWQYLSSLNSSINYITFGSATGQFIVQGQYDGDNKTDPGVWQQSSGQFASYNSTNGGASFFSLGQSGDYPPANYNQH